MGIKYCALESLKEENAHLLKIVEKDVGNLPAGDILINVKYSSLNYKDAMSAKGIPGVTRDYPHVPGIDASGIVVETNNKNIKEGDFVIVTGYDLGMNTSGGFSEYIRVPSEWVIRLPDNISLRESMIIGTAGLTAGLSVEALEKHFKINETLSLVTGATGGVGSIGIMLLSQLGSEVTAISGKSDQNVFLQSLGAKEILGRDDFYKTIRQPLSKPIWDIAIDVAGGSMIPAVLAALKPAGAVACSGLVAGLKFEASMLPFILRGISLIGIDSVEIPLNKKENIWKKFSSDWSLSKLEEVTKEISLSDLPQEIDLILSGNQVGRVLIKL